MLPNYKLLAQTIHTYQLKGQKIVRKINKYTISNLIDKLSCESWDSIFNSVDVIAMFNSSLNIYLRTFYSTFPLKK